MWHWMSKEQSPNPTWVGQPRNGWNFPFRSNTVAYMTYYQIKKEQSHNFLRVLRTPVHPIVNVIGHRLKAIVFCYGSNPLNLTEEFSDLVLGLFLGSIQPTYQQHQEHACLSKQGMAACCSLSRSKYLMHVETNLCSEGSLGVRVPMSCFTSRFEKDSWL